MTKKFSVSISQIELRSILRSLKYFSEQNPNYTRLSKAEFTRITSLVKVLKERLAQIKRTEYFAGRKL